MIRVLLGRGLLFLVALLTMRLCTSVFNPSEFAKISIITTTTAFFALFLINPIGMYINRRLHAWDEHGKFTQYLRYYLVYLVCIAFFACICLFYLYKSGVVDFGITFVSMSLLVCMSILFSTLNQTVIPSLNLLGDTNSFLFLSLITSVISVCFAYLFATCIQSTPEIWQFGILLGHFVVGLIGFKVLVKRTNTQSHQTNTLSLSKFKKLALFAWPVSLSAGLTWMQLQSYRYLATEYLGLYELGLLVAGFTVSSGIIAGLESVLTTYFQPTLYKDSHTDSDSDISTAWSKYAEQVLPPIILTTGFISALSDELSFIFLGNQFALSAKFVLWGAFVELSRVIASTATLHAHVHMKTERLITPNLIGAFITFMCLLIFMKPYGYIAVAISLALGQLFVAGMLLGNVSVNHIKTQAVAVAYAVLMAIIIYIFAEMIRRILPFPNIPLKLVTMTSIAIIYVLFLHRLLTIRIKPDASEAV